MSEAMVEPSPGHWDTPEAVRPAWNWVPPDTGLRPRLDRVPVWVRAWFRTPFLDRYAYEWMWHRGGWDIVTDPNPGITGPGAGSAAPVSPDSLPPDCPSGALSADSLVDTL